MNEWRAALPADAQRTLETARGDDPSAEARARLRARVAGIAAGAAITTAVAAPSSATSWAGLAGAKALKATLGAFVVGGLLVVAILAFWPPAAPAEPAESDAAPADPAPSAAAPADPTAVAPPPIAEPSADEPVPPPTDDPTPSAAPAEEPATGDPRAPVPNPLEVEVRLLRQARAALASRPRAALRIADEHRRRFPNGVLADEREVLAIEALLAGGDEASARRRAQDFSGANPSSPQHRRVGHLLEDGTEVGAVDGTVDDAVDDAVD